VAVEDVVLQNLIKLDRSRHTDGKGFGPTASQFGDHAARVVLEDAIAANQSQRPVQFDNEGLDKFCTLLFVRDKPGTEFEGAAGFVGVQLRADETTKEIQIVDTIKDSPAQKSGLKQEDVLLTVGSDAAADLQQTVQLVGS